MTQKEKEKIIKANMALGMTKEEAEQVLEDDLKIDKGETCEWETEQTPEQKKMLRKLLRAESDKPKEKKTRTKVPNNDKQFLIDTFRIALYELEYSDNVVITNNEREITFTYKDTNYKLTLSVPRTPKN